MGNNTNTNNLLMNQWKMKGDQVSLCPLQAAATALQCGSRCM